MNNAQLVLGHYSIINVAQYTELCFTLTLHVGLFYLQMLRTYVFGGAKMWNKVEQILIEKDISQYELAKRMGVSTGTITELKKGRIKKPSFELIQKIADALDVSMDRFR